MIQIIVGASALPHNATMLTLTLFFVFWLLGLFTLMPKNTPCLQPVVENELHRHPILRPRARSVSQTGARS